MTSFGALLLAAPLSIAIGLFLSELAPPAIRGPIGSLIQMLAAVPSVVIGLWGILVLGPFIAQHVEPFLITASAGSRSSASAALRRAVFSRDRRADDHDDPDHSSICRELFLECSARLKEASIGLGATRWEMVADVVVPSVRGGVVAGIILGLGRALGEAIAVTQVIGNGSPIELSLFAPGNTLASQIANQYQSAIRRSSSRSLIYLGLILLVITFTRTSSRSGSSIASTGIQGR